MLPWKSHSSTSKLVNEVNAVKKKSAHECSVDTRKNLISSVQLNTQEGSSGGLHSKETERLHVHTPKYNMLANSYPHLGIWTWNYRAGLMLTTIWSLTTVTHLKIKSTAAGKSWTVQIGTQETSKYVFSFGPCSSPPSSWTSPAAGSLTQVSRRHWWQVGGDSILALLSGWQLRQYGHQVGRQHRLVQVVEVRMLDHCLGRDAVYWVKQQSFLRQSKVQLTMYAHWSWSPQHQTAAFSVTKHDTNLLST